ncbi:hypothetical protein SK128_023130 [Halocaridina rubra]|uniref:H15 domain-containing protein n=1 Tax=Halocaridina rubra TaxID=373956 RepID=A0AAN8X9H3_HALRR
MSTTSVDVNNTKPAVEEDIVPNFSNASVDANICVKPVEKSPKDPECATITSDSENIVESSVINASDDVTKYGNSETVENVDKIPKYLDIISVSSDSENAVASNIINASNSGTKSGNSTIKSYIESGTTSDSSITGTRKETTGENISAVGDGVLSGMQTDGENAALTNVDTKIASVVPAPTGNTDGMEGDFDINLNARVPSLESAPEDAKSITSEKVFSTAEASNSGDSTQSSQESLNKSSEAAKNTTFKKRKIKDLFSHRPYLNMIEYAIESLGNPKGSSRRAIMQFILSKYQVPDKDFAAHCLKYAFGKGTEDGTLKQVKDSFIIVKSQQSESSTIKTKVTDANKKMRTAKKGNKNVNGSRTKKEIAAAVAKNNPIRKQKHPAANPSYAAMIVAAIKASRKPSGISRYAIMEFITSNYRIVDKRVAIHRLRNSIKNGLKNGTLRLTKGNGACGIFKIGTQPTEATKKSIMKQTSATRTTGIQVVQSTFSANKEKEPKVKKSNPKGVKNSTKKVFIKSVTHDIKVSVKKPNNKNTKRKKDLENDKTNKATDSPQRPGIKKAGTGKISNKSLTKKTIKHSPPPISRSKILGRGSQGGDKWVS